VTIVCLLGNLVFHYGQNGVIISLNAYFTIILTFAGITWLT
jgi:hypothetical protein